MVKTVLKMGTGSNCWDKLRLVIHDESDVISLVPFKDRDSALDAYNQMVCAHFEGHTGDMDIEIDGKIYSMSFELWQAILSCLDQWYEEYMTLVEGVGTI